RVPAPYREIDRERPSRLYSRRLRGNFFPAPRVRDKQCQGRRRDAVDPGRMSNRAWPVGLEFLFDLVRETRQRRIIEIIRPLKAFIAPIGGDISRLTRKINVILGIDLDLLGDLGCELAKAWPDLRKIGDCHAWIGQQFESGAALPILVER